MLWLRTQIQPVINLFITVFRRRNTKALSKIPKKKLLKFIVIVRHRMELIGLQGMRRYGWTGFSINGGNICSIHTLQVGASIFQLSQDLIFKTIKVRENTKRNKLEERGKRFQMDLKLFATKGKKCNLYNVFKSFFPLYICFFLITRTNP